MSLASGQPQQTPKKEPKVYSPEHKRTLELAEQILEKLKTRFPNFLSELSNFKSRKDFDTEYDDKEAGYILGKNIDEWGLPIGEIEGFPYTLKISLTHHHSESRKQKHPDPEMMSMVRANRILVKIEPTNFDDASDNHIADVNISLARFEDEDAPVDPAVYATIPKSNPKETQDVGMGMSINFQVFDDKHVPKYYSLPVGKIARSTENPDLGDNALRQINEVLSSALRNI